MLLIETSLLALALLIAFTYPALGSDWFDALEHRFSALARRRGSSVLLVGVIALSLRAAVLPVEPMPEPIVHDEFGYLLAADTFAHGRLTNPTPPMWEHFETFSILMKPTYQCFAQPAQGMMLALGKVVFGHPFWGVWLSCGLMCAAITWMVQGWFAPEWALLAGILAVLRYGVFGYWADSYWGGAVGAIGGALVLGALPRIKQSQRVRDALLMALGLATLANNRPFEGFVFSIPVAVVLVAWLLGKKSPPLRMTLRTVVAPLALSLAIVLIGTGYYFWRVTGSPFRFPYQIERQTYAVVPYMLWQPVRPEPLYHHAVMQKMYAQDELFGYKFSRTPAGVIWKIYLGWNYFLGPALTLPFLLLAFTLPKNLSWSDIPRPILFLLSILAASLVGSFLETFYGPHYSAPATSLFVTLVLLAMKHVRASGARGLFLCRAIPVVCLASFGMRAAAEPLHIPLPRLHVFSWAQQGAPEFGRRQILATLSQLPGNQLVIVRYKPDREAFSDWVYNDADIPGSKVVWARDMDAVENQRLIDHFKDRQVWLLDADKTPLRLQPWNQPSPVHDAGVTAATESGN